VRSETNRPPFTQAEREAARKRIFSAFGRFARTGLDWEERHLDLLLAGGFDHTATEFLRLSREFDPGVSAVDIFQACRNVWTANGLQRMLGLPVRLTPGIFAYSLLYPYTDNYLDDPESPEETKQGFAGRLRSRLEGQAVAPANAGEKAIFRLVSMIDGQYERSRYPQVFESLLAIHQAQVKSLRLLRSKGRPSEAEVLEIVLEKGGASVLADGCLVAGILTPSQVEFLFGFGAFLQLMDDLEDVQQDKHAGLLTVFSQTAGRRPLDEVTDRTFAFGQEILTRLDGFGTADSGPLKELIRSVLIQGIVLSAGRAGRFYSRAYLRELEAHSPFRFSFYNLQRRKLLRRRASLARLFEAFASSL
jgi:hypothetical protein